MKNLIKKILKEDYRETTTNSKWFPALKQDVDLTGMEFVFEHSGQKYTIAGDDFTNVDLFYIDIRDGKRVNKPFPKKHVINWLLDGTFKIEHFDTGFDPFKDI